MKKLKQMIDKAVEWFSIALVIVIMFRPRGIMGSREFALCDIPRWPARLRAWRTARSEGRSVQKEAKHHV